MKVKNTGLKYISIVVDTNRYEFAPNQEILFPDKQQPYVDQSILQYDDLVVISDNKTEGDKLVALIDQVNALPVSNSGVSTDLSNLSATTAVNSDLSPNALNSINLGTPSLPFKDAFLKSVNLSDGNTNPTMHLGYNKLIGDAGITFMTPDNMDDAPTNPITIRTGNTNGTSLAGDIVIGTGINVDHVNSHNFKSKVIVPDDTTLRVTNGVSNLDIRSASIESIGYPLSITTSILSITNSAFNIVSDAFNFVVSTITNSVDNFHLKPIGVVAPILKLWNESNTFSIGLDAKGALSDKVYTLPVNDGAAGNTLATDGNGNMSWVTPASGGSGASQSLNNLTTTAVNASIDPAVHNTVGLGTFAKMYSAIFGNVVHGNSFILENGNIALQGATTMPNGVSSTGTIKHGTNVNGVLGVVTADNTYSDNTKSSEITIQTGNKTAGSGSTGDISLITGSNSAATGSGSVKIKTGLSPSGVRGDITFDSYNFNVNSSLVDILAVANTMRTVSGSVHNSLATSSGAAYLQSSDSITSQSSSILLTPQGGRYNSPTGSGNVNQIIKSDASGLMVWENTFEYIGLTSVFSAVVSRPSVIKANVPAIGATVTLPSSTNAAGLFVAVSSNVASSSFTIATDNTTDTIDDASTSITVLAGQKFHLYYDGVSNWVKI